MKHYFRIFSISALLFFLLNSILMQSVAEPGTTPVLFTKEDQTLHIEKMKSMTPEQKAQYRSEQYALLRQKAAAIGYEMPVTPPWQDTVSESDTTSTLTDEPSDEVFNSRHKNQLAKYRQDAADKRKAMHERLEKQREQIKQRIATLVEKQAVKSAESADRRPTPPPRPAMVPADNYPGASFYPPPPPRAMAPAYPGYYQLPPAPPRPWGYPY